MAQIGLKHMVIAPITASPDGAEPTYGAGMKVGELMRANISWNRSDVKLYGDDKLVARDNSVTSGTLTIGTTYIDREAKLKMFDMAAYNTPATGGVQEYALGGEASPKVGCGYVYKDLQGDENVYVAYWYWKVQFSMNETMNTRGESTEYGTPEIEGEIFAALPKADLAARFRKEAEFATEAEAIAWLNSLASIT